MGLGLVAAVLLLAGAGLGRAALRVSSPLSPGRSSLGLILGGTALGATAATFQRVPAAFAIAVFAVLSAAAPDPDRRRDELPPDPALRSDRGRLPRGAWLCVVGREEELRTPSSPRVGRGAGGPLALHRAGGVARRLRAGHRVVGQPDQRGADRRVLPRALRLDARAPSRRALAPEARGAGCCSPSRSSRWGSR